jgi:hypothetical protein
MHLQFPATLEAEARGLRSSSSLDNRKNLCLTHTKKYMNGWVESWMRRGLLGELAYTTVEADRPPISWGTKGSW